MKTVELPEEILEKLQQVEGKDFAEKIVNLLKQRIFAQLRECDEQILKYETKYGMDFDQFESAWKRDELEGKHSHEVERDLMEWEGFVLERQKWLSMLRGLKG
jgi:translation initiation factor 2 alpha subunit (eIF-2alpha)